MFRLTTYRDAIPGKDHNHDYTELNEAFRKLLMNGGVL